MPSRIVAESICTSEQIDALTLGAEVFWYRLLVQCDDFGRYDARPAILRSRCFPLRTARVSDRDVAGWLDELVGQDLVRVYEHDGRPYLVVVKWDGYQRRRASSSRWPDPPDDPSPHSDDGDSRASDGQTPDIGGQVTSDVAEVRSSICEVRSTNASSTRASRAEEIDAQFVSFWEHYPRHRDRGAALRAWRARIRQGADPQQLIAAAQHYADHVRIAGRAPDYVKHGATFLGPAEPWRDYVDGIPDDELRTGTPALSSGQRAALAYLEEVTRDETGSGEALGDARRLLPDGEHA